MSVAEAKAAALREMERRCFPPDCVSTAGIPVFEGAEKALDLMEQYLTSPKPSRDLLGNLER